MQNSGDSLRELVDFSRENSHGVLHEEEQGALKCYLEDNYSQDVVSDFYDKFNWMYEWKAHRGADESVKLAVAYSRAMGLDESEVKNYTEIDASEVTDEHVSVAGELHEPAVSGSDRSLVKLSLCTVGSKTAVSECWINCIRVIQIV